MFDPVTDEVLRRRRQGFVPQEPSGEPKHRTSLVCHVCGREIRPEEEFFTVDGNPHCFQCHGMLEFELEKERERDAEVRKTGTKWDAEEEE